MTLEFAYLPLLHLHTSSEGLADVEHHLGQRLGKKCNTQNVEKRQTKMRLGRAKRAPRFVDEVFFGTFHFFRYVSSSKEVSLLFYKDNRALPGRTHLILAHNQSAVRVSRPKPPHPATVPHCFCILSAFLLPFRGASYFSFFGAPGFAILV